jgi:hypothetical protein
VVVVSISGCGVGGVGGGGGGSLVVLVHPCAGLTTRNANQLGPTSTQWLWLLVFWPRLRIRQQQKVFVNEGSVLLPNIAILKPLPYSHHGN